MKKLLIVMATGSLLWSSELSGQNNWVSFGQDHGGDEVLTLTQINTSNVKDLMRAWTFHTGDVRLLRSTPIVVDSVMYFSRAQRLLRGRCRDRPADLEIRRHVTHDAARRLPTGPAIAVACRGSSHRRNRSCSA